MTAIKQIEDALPDLPKLARHLLNAGYSHGMADQTPHMSNNYYSKADDKSRKALRDLFNAIAAQDADIARLREVLSHLLEREWQDDKWDSRLVNARKQARVALATTSKGAA